MMRIVLEYAGTLQQSHTRLKQAVWDAMSRIAQM